MVCSGIESELSEERKTKEQKKNAVDTRWILNIPRKVRNDFPLNKLIKHDGLIHDVTPAIQRVHFLPPT